MYEAYRVWNDYRYITTFLLGCLHVWLRTSNIYIRYENDSGEISVALVMGKSRVSPTKATAVPRLELTAALLSCRIGTQVKAELEIEDISEQARGARSLDRHYLFKD